MSMPLGENGNVASWTKKIIIYKKNARLLCPLALPNHPSGKKISQ
jgi:hypothetical protein